MPVSFCSTSSSSSSGCSSLLQHLKHFVLLGMILFVIRITCTAGFCSTAISFHPFITFEGEEVGNCEDVDTREEKKDFVRILNLGKGRL